MKVKSKKKKLKVGKLLLILLIIYLIGMLGYYFFTMPVKNIIVKGNHLVSEKEILEASKIHEDTSLFKVTTGAKKKIKKSIPLINNVKVKKNLLGNVIITVEENKILFYNVLEEKYILSNGSKIKDNGYIGYPSLINYVPSEILSSFIKKLSKVDENVIKMISEIEYSPDKHDDVVIDDERFLMRMNDGNMVYINTVNIEKLNKYQTIYASLKGKGTLYLDSSSKNYIFETKKEEKKEEEKDKKEDQKDEQSTANEN